MVKYNYKKYFCVILFISVLIFSNPYFAISGPFRGTTLVLDPSQYTTELKKHNPSYVYILYWGTLDKYSMENKNIFKGDTIINYKVFTDSFSKPLSGYRLIYQSNNVLDSIWDLDNKFRITNKYYNLQNGLLKCIPFDTSGKKKDEFIYDYIAKLLVNKKSLDVREKHAKILPSFLREYIIYNSFDRIHYTVPIAWILSIGIDDYGPTQYQSCKADAISYVDFFKKQYARKYDTTITATFFHQYLLLDKNASKDSILNALKEITLKASTNDYFIFIFDGCSNLFNADKPVTHFFPFNVTVINQSRDGATLKNRNSTDTTDPSKNCIPLNILQEYIQFIPANKQLFISEAGPSDKFKTEFIKTLMQNSPEIASILNKDRIIMVPNGFGLDGLSCQGEYINRGPINFYITSLDTSVNIFNLFEDDYKSAEAAFKIKNREFECRSFSSNYFDIFFERQFLKQYNEIFGNNSETIRGIGGIRSKELQQTVNNLTAKHYALIVGTDEYKGKGWRKLSNPVSDARAVAEELENSYGFDVQLLENKPMDSIYKAIREYYRIAKPNDQLVIYFAGHGDADDELLSDGFVVCTDSRSVEDDPVRNSYISYTRLQRMLNNIPARQILVLLDVCHGGTFDAKAFDNQKRENTPGEITNKNVLEFLKKKLPLRTRKFLSSVGIEPAFDGQAGRHSPFANKLLQVLRERGNGTDGIITLSQIYAVLQSASTNQIETLRIAPAMNDFGNPDAFSEFIFIPVEKGKAKQE